GQFDSLIKTIFLHAIFEIPATLLSVVLSLQISFFIYYRIVKKEKFTIKLSKMLGVFLSVVLLTLIAAIIEGIR
ncbi:TPA: stage II sporulation protein M, partial [Bacillus cereus]|nr:stage II sporulation protein M [Bacillus cereus]